MARECSSAHLADYVLDRQRDENSSHVKERRAPLWTVRLCRYGRFQARVESRERVRGENVGRVT